MNKNSFFLLFCFLLSSLCFSVERGIIFTENLRIRDTPSTNGNIVGNCLNEVVVQQNTAKEVVFEVLYENMIVNIYEKSGTQTMQNGTFDYWYKISDTKNYWINAYYVALFPIYFRSAYVQGEKDYKIMNIDETGLAHYFIFDEYIFSNTIEKRDYTLYDELYPKMLDNSYLRLSEFIKDVNQKLNINDQYVFPKKESTKSFSLYPLPLWYGVKTVPNLESLKNILGWTRTGSHSVQDFEIIDVDKTYSLSVIHTMAEKAGDEQKIMQMMYYVRLR
jgi:hypothetical protein